MKIRQQKDGAEIRTQLTQLIREKSKQNDRAQVSDSKPK
jgi:hypothetical protein